MSRFATSPRGGVSRAPARNRGDPALVARLRAGDGSAYVDLLREHGPAMYAAVRRCVDDDASAQDALQDAFISVFRGIGRFEGASRLSTWLHRVAVNAALMQRRTRARRPVSLLDSPGLEALADASYGPRGIRADAPASPAELLATQEAAARLHRCIERLPLRSRGAVELHDLGGRSLRETAHLLHISLSAVKSRLDRGRDFVRAEYRAEGLRPERLLPR